MGYVCAKGLNLGTKEYHPGDSIPDGVILGSRVRALLSSGYIVENKAENDVIDLTGIDPMQFADSVGVILDKSQDPQITTTVNGEQLQAIVDLMQKGAKDAAAAIEEEVDETVLEFIWKVDSRKTVYEAAEKQLHRLINLREDKIDSQANTEHTEVTGEE